MLNEKVDFSHFSSIEFRKILFSSQLFFFLHSMDLSSTVYTLLHLKVQKSNFRNIEEIQKLISRIGLLELATGNDRNCKIDLKLN